MGLSTPLTAAPPPPVRLGRNATLNLLGTALPLLVALGAIPIVVRGLGPARFGLLALAWTVVGYLGVLDLGFGRAATKRVSEAAWTGAAHRVRSLADNVIEVQAAFGALTGALLWLFAALLAAVLVPDAALRAEGAAVLAVLALAVPAVLVSNACRSILEGLHRFDLVNYARAPLAAAIFVVSAAGTLAGWSLAVIVAGLVVTRYAGVFVYGGFYLRAAPPGPVRVEPSDIADLMRFGGWVAVSNAIVPFSLYLERFVLSALRGPAALAYYSAPQELVLKLHMVPAAVTGVLFPAFSGLSARGDTAELLRQVRRGIRIVALLLVMPAALLVVTAEPLLTLWLGADYGRTSATVLRILAVAAFLNGLAYLPFVLAEGVGKPGLVARYHLLELPLYAAALWLLTTRFGIVGTASAWALRMVFMAPLMYLLVMRHAGVGLLAPVKGSAGAALTAALLLLGTAALLPTLLPSGVAAAAAALLLVGAFAGLAWMRLLEGEDRAALRALAAAAARALRLAPRPPQEP
jgi:O-antigen/teichoic acid export membrane protein